MEVVLSKRRLGGTILTIVLVLTLLDTGYSWLTMPVREDVMKTIPMIGEVISEGFNVIFALTIMVFLTYGYEKGKPFYIPIFASILFYFSLLHDFFDEFFIMSIPSIGVEVFAFPFSLILAALGIYQLQGYQKKLFQDNEVLKESYQRLSVTDSLTGLYNTRHFYDHVPDLIKQTSTDKQLLVLMLLDIDDFKQVNDTYGHLEGDHLIAAFAKAIIKSFGQDFLCYRYGGEEFVVVLEGVSIETSKEKAEDFRERFSKMVFEIGEEKYSKTISIGLTELDELDDARKILDKADRAMYVAKTTGKNKVMIFGQE